MLQSLTDPLVLKAEAKLVFSTIRAVGSCLLGKFLFIWIFFTLWAHIHVAHGQVVIRETVTLTPEVTGTPNRVTGNVFVAPDSGTYWGRIGLARKYSPITYGPLTVVHRDTMYVFDTREYVLNTWSYQQVQWRCSDPNTPIWYTAYYAYDTENPLRFFLPDVHVGDTIQFMYAGVLGTDDCPPGGVSATICMYASDSCYYYMEGELQELWYCTVELGVLSAEHAGYRVVAEDDTIGAGTSTPVRAIAVDSTDWEVPTNSTTRLVYRLIPETLGRFVDAAGDTLPSPLPNVVYADARAGRVRFLAADSLKDSVFAVIEVVQSLDTTKRGHDTVWIRNPVKVVFTKPDSAVVYPTYAGHNDAAARRNWIDLELRVISGDSTSVPNYWVKVLKPVLVDSGGHSHGGNRPMGEYRHPIGSATSVDTIRAQTDSTGRLKFRYMASQFGGAESIRAQAVGDTTKFDTLSLLTRVPGLQLLPQGTNYVKIGGTCRHHGPEGPTSCSTPDNDHWATAGLIENIRTIADSFAHYYPNYRIRINDISLPHGGGFDLGGDWEADIIDQFPASRDTCNLVGHCTHREGNMADISYYVRPPSGSDSLMTPSQRRRLRRILDNTAGSVLEHGHYHFRGR